jgi:hypothetical protein
MEQPKLVVLDEQATDDKSLQRWTIIATILLCTLISGLLGDSLLGVWRIAVGDAIPRGWQWLLGSDLQTYRTQTVALLLGVVLLGFALGGVWFTFVTGLRWLRRRLLSV